MRWGAAGCCLLGSAALGGPGSEAGLSKSVWPRSVAAAAGAAVVRCCAAALPPCQSMAACVRRNLGLCKVSVPLVPAVPLRLAGTAGAAGAACWRAGECSCAWASCLGLSRQHAQHLLNLHPVAHAASRRAWLKELHQQRQGTRVAETHKGRGHGASSAEARGPCTCWPARQHLQAAAVQAGQPDLAAAAAAVAVAAAAAAAAEGSSIPQRLTARCEGARSHRASQNQEQDQQLQQ